MGLKLTPLSSMKTAMHSVSACRRCRYYQVEGRRGGHCRQLSVSVQANWRACSLASPLFESTCPIASVMEEIMGAGLESLDHLPLGEVGQPEIITEPVPMPVGAEDAATYRIL